MRDLGSPVHARDWFQAIVNAYEDRVRVAVVIRRTKWLPQRAWSCFTLPEYRSPGHHPCDVSTARTPTCCCTGLFWLSPPITVTTTLISAARRPKRGLIDSRASGEPNHTNSTGTSQIAPAHPGKKTKDRERSRWQSFNQEAAGGSPLAEKVTATWNRLARAKDEEVHPFMSDVACCS